MVATEPNNGKDLPEEKLPDPGEPVWVQCKGYRIMAVRDAKGKWRTLVANEEITGPVKVLGKG